MFRGRRRYSTLRGPPCPVLALPGGRCGRYSRPAPNAYLDPPAAIGVGTINERIRMWSPVILEESHLFRTERLSDVEYTSSCPRG